MSYSLDLRKRVINYLKEGGSKVQARKIFKVNRQTIYNWLARKELSPSCATTRRRKLDKLALASHVRNHPDVLLRERADHFKVCISSMWMALHKINITKKNDILRPKKPR